MLLDRAGTLAAKINAYQKLQSTAQEADQFATRATQFNNVALLIARLRETLDRLAAAGVPVEFEPSDGAEYAGKARTLREAVKANPKGLNDPPFDLKYAFTDRLIGIAGAGERAASAAWKAYVEKRSSFGADDVLSALETVPQFRASVAKLRQLRSEIAALGASLPSDPAAAVAKLSSLISQHEAAWTSLAASDIPPSVVAFIRAAANGSALLSSFTGEVRSWLESRDLLNAFRIKLR